MTQKGWGEGWEEEAQFEGGWREQENLCNWPSPLVMKVDLSSKVIGSEGRGKGGGGGRSLVWGRWRKGLGMGRGGGGGQGNLCNRPSPQVTRVDL